MDTQVEQLNIFDGDPKWEYYKELRTMIAVTVISIFYSENRTVKRSEIYELIRAKVKQRIKDGTWKNTWKLPNDRTIGRILDQTINGTYYPDGIPRLQECSTNHYCPYSETPK